MNWTALIIVALLLKALVVFIILKNIKDEKEFEQQLNEDYRKSKDAEREEDSDAITH